MTPQDTKSRYKKLCPECKGDFIIGWTKPKPYWGIFCSPPSPILCDKCHWGYIYPKEIIMRLDSFEPILNY